MKQSLGQGRPREVTQGQARSHLLREALPNGPSPLTYKGHEAGLVNEYPDAKAENKAA